MLDPSNEVPNPSLRLVAESSSVGDRGEVQKLLDDNLFAVLKKASLTVEAEAVPAIKRRPTRDLYALTIYGRALNLFFGLGIARDPVKAITLFKKVNLIDPKMAEAHRMLGVVSARDVIAYIVKHSREHVVTAGGTTSHGVEGAAGGEA